MRILFWGTPEFALPSLRALLGEGHDVVSVVTQPDRRAGRGRSVASPPVKVLAEQEFIPVLQPEKPTGDDLLYYLRGLEPDLSVVVAYGQILRPEMLALPSMGSINVHASLLPALRGAAPIQWAIMRGHAETGVTIMRMVQALDAGPILRQVPEPIGPEETARDLGVRLSELGAEALVETLALMEVGEVAETPQDEAAATYAPRLSRADAHVDWKRDAAGVGCQIRGLDAVPGAWSSINGQEVKLYRPLPEPDRAHDAAPGTVLEVRGTDPTAAMLVACGRGALCVREVKPAGKRRMTAAEWVRGRGVAAGDRFS